MLGSVYLVTELFPKTGRGFPCSQVVSLVILQTIHLSDMSGYGIANTEVHIFHTCSGLAKNMAGIVQGMILSPGMSRDPLGWEKVSQ